MPIRMSDRGEQELPVVVCDHCGGAITDARKGNAHWRFGPDGRLTDDEVLFTHKDCCAAFDLAHPGETQAMELVHWVYWLARRLRYPLPGTEGRKRSARATTHRSVRRG